MKQITALLLACTFIITNNSFGMLNKISSTKQIKKIRSFHTTLPSRDMDIVSIFCIALTTSNLYDIHRLQNEVSDLKKTIEQNEEQNKLMLKALKQNAQSTINTKE